MATNRWDAFQTFVIAAAVVAVVLIVFGTFVKGCEQVEMTKRKQVDLQIEQVKNNYHYERSQTTTVGPSQK
jgi:uncharacterized lipoprotein YehR (DUF1307 family)